MQCNGNDVSAMMAFRISMFLFSGISIMISANTFQGTKQSGNIDQESDTENVPEHFENDDAFFKPAGELEVDNSSCTSHNDSESEVEVPTPKRQKTCSQLWKKNRKRFLKIYLHLLLIGLLTCTQS